MKEIKRTKIEIIKRFLNPYKENKAVAFRSIIFYGLWAIGPIVHVFFVERLVGLIEKGIKDSFIETLVYYGIFIVLFEVLLYITRKWGWVEINIYRKTIHNYYIKKFTILNNTDTEKLGTGKLISLMGTGIDIWTLALDDTMENILKVLFTVIFSFYMIASVNILYGIVFLIFYIIIHIIGGYFNKKTLVHRRKRQDAWNTYTGQMVKILMSKFEILQTSSVKKELKILNETTDNMLNHSLLMVNPNHWFYQVPKIFISLIKFGVLGFLGFQVIEGSSTLAIFVGLFGTLSLMDSVIANSMKFYNDLTKNFTKIEKMWDLFDSTPEIQGYENGKDFVYKSGAIELQNITFGYEENKKIFKNFNLKLNGGKITAFVGNSGGGKTTLVKIISQYIKQDSGKVIIDGQDLDEVSLKSYYKNIGYLTQEPSVFDGTILDNLTYALEELIPHPTPLLTGEGIENAHSFGKEKGLGGEVLQEKIHKIISLSKCEFIYDFEKGLETEIGERGVRLSGGQRQRLAIAKIMLKDPKIIILDEPTSALDSFSEELITKAMNNLFEGRTVLVIAHRLQTVKHADEIIVIENGEIAERGNHNELVEKNGIYNRMLELQSGF